MKENYFIKIDTSPGCTSFNYLVISGEFMVSNKEKSITSENSQILKHVVLVVTRSANYQSVTPFSDTVVFKDDVKIDSDIVSGVFKVQLGEHIGFNGKGDFFVMCSLGNCLSNVLKITI